MNLFVVKAESGTWDGYHWWIHGIYLSPAEAGIAREKLIQEYKKRSEVPCPIPNIKLDEYDDPVDLKKKDSNTYYRWCNQIREAKDFRGAKIIVYEVGISNGEYDKENEITI